MQSKTQEYVERTLRELAESVQSQPNSRRYAEAISAFQDYVNTRSLDAKVRLYNYVPDLTVKFTELVDVVQIYDRELFNQLQISTQFSAEVNPKKNQAENAVAVYKAHLLEIPEIAQKVMSHSPLIQSILKLREVSTGLKKIADQYIGSLQLSTAINTKQNLQSFILKTAKEGILPFFWTVKPDSRSLPFDLMRSETFYTIKNEFVNSDGKSAFCNRLKPHLQDFNFSNSNVCKVDFRNANLVGATFIGSRTTEADFNNANLQDANFAGVTVARAFFTNANLQGANLAGTDITIQQLKGAKSIIGAKFEFEKSPQGIKRISDIQIILENQYTEQIAAAKDIDSLINLYNLAKKDGTLGINIHAKGKGIESYQKVMQALGQKLASEINKMNKPMDKEMEKNVAAIAKEIQPPEKKIFSMSKPANPKADLEQAIAKNKASPPAPELPPRRGPDPAKPF